MTARLAMAVAVAVPSVVATESLVAPIVAPDAVSSVAEAAGTGAGYSAIVDLMVVAHENAQSATPKACGSDSRTTAKGWVWDRTDLNQNAGGDYVYLCYRIADADGSNGTAVSNVTIGIDRCPAGYTRRGSDLNSDAGGETLYLCTSHSGSDELLGIAVTSGCGACTPSCPVSSYASRGRTDLNLGAGGLTQYLCLTFASNVDRFTNCGGNGEFPCDHPAAFPDCDRGLREGGGGRCVNDERRSSDADYTGYFNSWEFHTYRMQRDRISADAPFTDVMRLEAHNSYANNNDGMGSLYNQTYSITDQLRAGARVIELDVHHDNGDTEPYEVRPLEIYHESRIEGVGVNQYYRYVHDALKEIGDWMRANPDQVVIVNLEQYVEQWGGTVLSYLVQKYLGDRAGVGLLDTREYDSDNRPTQAELVAAGNRAIVVANGTVIPRTDLGLAKQDAFPIIYIGNLYEPSTTVALDDLTDAQLTNCRFAGSKTPREVRDGDRKMVRTYPELSNQGSASDVAKLAACGVTDIAIDDLLCPNSGCDYRDDLDRLDDYVWSWEDGHWPQKDRAAAMLSTGRWRSIDPTTSYRYACRTASDAWVLASAPAGPFADGAAACAADGHTFSFPRSHWENADLKAVAGGATVWLAFTSLFDPGWDEARLAVKDVTITAPTVATRRVSWSAESSADLVPGWPADTTYAGNVQPDCGTGSGGTAGTLIADTVTITDGGAGTWSGSFECWFPTGETDFDVGVRLTDPIGLTAARTTTTLTTARPNATPEILAVERFKFPNLVGVGRFVSFELRDLDPGETINVSIVWDDGVTQTASFATSTTFSADSVLRWYGSLVPYDSVGTKSVTVHASNGTPTPGASGTSTATGTIEIGPRASETKPVVTPVSPPGSLDEAEIGVFRWTVTDKYDSSRLQGTLYWGDDDLNPETLSATDLEGVFDPTVGAKVFRRERSFGEESSGVDVRLVVTDTFENVTTESVVPVEVRNVRPVLDRIEIEPEALLVGTTAELTIDAVDPNPAEILQAYVSWPGGSETGPHPMVATGAPGTRRTVTLSHTVTSLGSSGDPLEVRVVDDDGSAVTGQRVLQSADIVSMGDARAYEGQAVSLDGWLLAGQNIDELEVDWGDGSPVENIPIPPENAGCGCHYPVLEHVYADGSGDPPDVLLAESYLPTLTAKSGGAVIDGDGGSVSVFEVRPVITAVDGLRDVPLGEPIQFVGTFADSSFDQHDEVAWDVESDELLPTTIDNAADTFTIDVPGDFYGPGRHVIATRVRETWAPGGGLGKFSAIEYVTVVVHAPPEIVVDEVVGAEGAETIIPIRIPIGPDSAPPQVVDVDFGDGSPWANLWPPYPPVDPTCACIELTTSHVYRDDGVYDVHVEMYDADSSLATADTTATIADVDPVILVDAPTFVAIGASFPVDISLTDVPDDAHTIAFTVDGLLAGAPSPTGPGTWSGDVTIASAGHHDVSVIATDTAGDLAPTQRVLRVLAADAGIAGVPTLDVRLAHGSTSPTRASTIGVRITADRPVIGLTIDDLVFAGTVDATAVSLTGGPTVFDAIISTSGTSGTLLVSTRPGAAIDVVGRGTDASAGLLVEVDRTAPRPEIDIAPGGVAASTTLPLTFGVNFGEPVSGFTATDVVLSGSAEPSDVRVSGGPAVYLVEVRGAAGRGTVGATIRSGSVQDLAGNANLTALQLGPGFTYEPVPIEPDPEPDGIVPTTPSRVWDTRDEPTVDGLFRGTGRLGARRTVRIQVAGRGGVPAGSTGVVANLTGIFPDGPGFATMFACTDRVPTASHLNFDRGDVVANNAVVPLDPGGGICVFTLTSTDFALDVNGYVPGSSPVTMVEPHRFLDTRDGEPTFDDVGRGGGRAVAGETVRVQIAGRGGVPDTATTVFANVTVVGADRAGFATVFPCGERPGTSTLNFVPGSATPNGAIAQLSSAGELCVYTLVDVHVIVDIAGFVGDSGRIDTMVPRRMLDSRDEPTIDGQFRNLGRVRAGQHVEIAVAGRAGVPDDATAAMFNVITVVPDGPGFVTLYPCGLRPGTSNLNHVRGGIVRANNAVTKLSPAGTVCVFTLAETDLVLDVTGWIR